MSCSFSLPIFRMSPKMIKKRKKKKPSVVIKLYRVAGKKGKWGSGKFVYIFVIDNASIMPTHIDIKLF